MRATSANDPKLTFSFWPSRPAGTLTIPDRLDDTAPAARNADQIEGRTVRRSARRHEAEPAIAGHGELASNLATMWVVIEAAWREPAMGL